MRVEALRFEQDLARDFAGRRVFLSGAGFTKADVRRQSEFVTTDKGVERTDAMAFRIEAKATAYDAYTFSVSDWYDLVRAADAAGETPVFAIRFVKARHELVIIRKRFAEELAAVPPLDVIIATQRSRRLQPGTFFHTRLLYPNHITRGARPPDVVTILPYDKFMERLKAHANFGAPDPHAS